MTPRRETLDVETDADRQERLARLLASIPSKPADETPVLTLPRSQPKPFALPPSDALARARAFLPLMKSSNVELLEKARLDPKGVDIENVEDEQHVIAMDLGLGVFDAPANTQGMGPVIDLPESESQEGSEAEDGDESENTETTSDNSEIETSDASSSDSEMASQPKAK
ncbi:NOP protein chaperone 1, partial [Tremellales sp. Uapishka_1]